MTRVAGKLYPHMPEFDVVIGSYALNCYLPEVEYRDIDIITSDKASWRSVLDNDAAKIDLSKTRHHRSNLIIHQYCNEHQDQCQTREIAGVTVLVAPLRLLYAIYKSHIHRLIPYTDIQSKNIDIWFKTMQLYTLIRNKLGQVSATCIICVDSYPIDNFTSCQRCKVVFCSDCDQGLRNSGCYRCPQCRYEYLIPPSNNNALDQRLREFDETMFEPRLGQPRDPNTVTDLLDKAKLTVFLTRFEETNAKYGDTRLSLDQSQQEFFQDNVPRLIEHDELHAQVAMSYRDTRELLFTQFQSDPASVNMDPVLFSQGDPSTQIQCIFEELVVLLLERKWMLEMHHNYRQLGKFYYYNIVDSEVKQAEIRDILCHFSTNLTGSGHSWLRRWMLDHFAQFADMMRYDLRKIYQIGLGIVYTPEEITKARHVTESSGPDDVRRVLGDFISRFNANTTFANIFGSKYNGEWGSVTDATYCYNCDRKLTSQITSDSCYTCVDSKSFNYFIAPGQQYCKTFYFGCARYVTINIESPIDIFELVKFGRSMPMGT